MLLLFMLLLLCFYQISDEALNVGMIASICIQFFFHDFPNSRPQVRREEEDLLDATVEIFEVFMVLDHRSQTDFVRIPANRVCDMEATQTGLNVWENGFNGVEDSLFAV